MHYAFDNKIIRHRDYNDPGPAEAIARMSLAWAMSVYPSPPDPTPHQKSIMGWQADSVEHWRTQVARIAGAMIDRQEWIQKECKVAACDMLGDICHSDNHQNQDVRDFSHFDQWWVIS